MTAPELSALLKGHRFRGGDEYRLQAGVAQILEAAGVAFEREREIAGGRSDLAKCRIDFLVGRVGLEIKVGGSTTEVLRQLHRYAGSPDVDELLLVTTRMRHRLPPTISGKPVHVVNLPAGIP